jgi:hypothetical protein
MLHSFELGIFSARIGKNSVIALLLGACDGTKRRRKTAGLQSATADRIIASGSSRKRRKEPSSRVSFRRTIIKITHF